MDKYKVLLVDDEEEAIEAIRLKLEWETLGFEVIGSANNGVKALELVERLQPDKKSGWMGFAITPAFFMHSLMSGTTFFLRRHAYILAVLFRELLLS